MLKQCRYPGGCQPLLSCARVERFHTMMLQAARIAQQAAEAEAVQLRTALRELRTQSNAAWDYGRAHADLAQAR